MSRKGPTKSRKIKPDAIYGSVLLNRIINYSMKSGKKSATRKQVYLALKLIKKQANLSTVEGDRSPARGEPILLLEQAIDNIKPKIEVRPRRIGGAVYQVPRPVSSRRQLSLSIRWLVNSARARPSKQYHGFGEKLAAEILSAFENEGSAINKKLEIEKMAEANKAFSHLRW
ncbi:30S ribosomal protein S7 [Patescibacteria group bacterium]|nr:30S ribosomal protein S7 [Patescibacteria group bacterium]